jgi:hypothetical protein
MAKKKVKPSRKPNGLRRSELKPAVEDKLQNLCYDLQDYPLERRIAAWLYVKGVLPEQLDEFFDRRYFDTRYLTATHTKLKNCLDDYCAGRYTLSPKLLALIRKL